MAALEHAKKTSDGLISASDWDASHATTETDTALVLAPDGIGGVEFRAERRTVALSVVFAAPVANDQIDVRIPFACVISSWALLADVSGAIVIDIWKDTLANYPPTDADAMPGAGKEPTIAASGTNAEDTTLTDWTTDDIAAGDVLRFNVDSCTTITRCTLTLVLVV
jgi:hypothetical protein